mgnify:CR=1 FL=1
MENEDALKHRLEIYGDNKPIVKKGKTLWQMVVFELNLGPRQFLRSHAQNPLCLSSGLPSLRNRHLRSCQRLA